MKADQIREVLDRIIYNGWEFLVLEDSSRMYLQLRFYATDTDSGDYVRMTGRKWILSEHMTQSEVVQTALKAVLTAEEHEVREKFLYRGVAVFGPHLDVEALTKIAEQQDRRSS